MERENDKVTRKLQCVNDRLIVAIKRLKNEISSCTERERNRLGNHFPRVKSLVSAVVFKDSKGMVHTALRVKSHVSSHFLARCLNSQSMWELDTLTNPTEQGYCRALANIKRDNNYTLQELSDITDFETIVQMS